MAKLLAGINGPIIGKIGTVVGSSYKGTPYIKARYRKKPARRTPDEAHNQSSFSKLHFWLQPILRFVREGYKGYSEKVEGFNAAKSYNLKHAFTGDKSDKELDPSLILVSYGDLPLPSHASIEKSGDFTLKFTWDPVGENYDSGQDQAMLLAYDAVSRQYRSNLYGQFRRMGTDSLELPPAKGYNYHVYLAFVSHDRARRSKSMYLGSVSV